MTQDQINVLALMPCSYEGFAPFVAGERPKPRSIIIDQLVALGKAEVRDGMAWRKLVPTPCPPRLVFKEMGSRVGTPRSARGWVTCRRPASH